MGLRDLRSICVSHDRLWVQAVRSLALTPDAVSSHLRVLTELQCHQPSGRNWAKEVLAAAEKQMADQHTRLQQSSDWQTSPFQNENLLTAAIFTTGKVG